MDWVFKLILSVCISFGFVKLCVLIFGQQVGLEVAVEMIIFIGLMNALREH